MPFLKLTERWGAAKPNSDANGKPDGVRPNQCTAADRVEGYALYLYLTQACLAVT